MLAPVPAITSGSSLVFSWKLYYQYWILPALRPVSTSSGQKSHSHKIPKCSEQWGEVGGLGRQKPRHHVMLSSCCFCTRDFQALPIRLGDGSLLPIFPPSCKASDMPSEHKTTTHIMSCGQRLAVRAGGTGGYKWGANFSRAYGEELKHES